MSFNKQMKALAFLIVLFTAVTVNAQNFILSGKVTDENATNPWSNVYCYQKLKKGTSTDFEGNFQLNLNKRNHYCMKFLMSDLQLCQKS